MSFAEVVAKELEGGNEGRCERTITDPLNKNMDECVIELLGA